MRIRLFKEKQFQLVMKGVLNKKQGIAKVTTEISFTGDIRDMKSFLLKNKDKLIPVPVKESKRDIPLKTRRKVIERANGLCERCNKKGEQIDHIIPFCAGGTHSLENLRLLCIECHRKTFSDFLRIKVAISNKHPIKILLKSGVQGVQ